MTQHHTRAVVVPQDATVEELVDCIAAKAHELDGDAFAQHVRIELAGFSFHEARERAKRFGYSAVLGRRARP